jgi:hypothetical protein
LPVQTLAIDQQTEAFLEGERVGVGCLALLLKGLRQRLPEVSVHLTSLTVYEALNDSYIGEAA